MRPDTTTKEVCQLGCGDILWPTMRTVTGIIRGGAVCKVWLEKNGRTKVNEFRSHTTVSIIKF